MESILSSGNDMLLPGLSYDLADDQASYVVEGKRKFRVMFRKLDQMMWGKLLLKSPTPMGSLTWHLFVFILLQSIATT